MKAENNKTRAQEGNIKDSNEGVSSSSTVFLNIASPFCTMVLVVNLFEWGIVCKLLNENN